MTPAEFDTRRRLLGLSVEEAADWCGANRTTVQRWVRGKARIHPRAVERLEELEEAMSEAVEQALDLARERGADKITLIRYWTQEALDASPHASGLPLGAHSMMIGWTADALEDDGRAVEIAWSEEPASP